MNLVNRCRALDLTEFGVALIIAIVICVLRVSLFDHALFSFRALPSHDSLSAAGMFQSSLHAIRNEGDIAWWLPSENGGYPQYYNLFLSPLAPTGGNILFMFWTEMVRFLGFVGVRAPEYFQFLVFEFIISPILTYTVLGLLLRRFCATWIAPILGVICYALSGTGLWNNAWMFYQEWMNIFLLLLALDLAIARPTPLRAALLGFAVLNIVSSANYWTLFSIWFVAAWVVTYAVCYWSRLRAIFIVLRRQRFATRSFGVILTGVIAATCLLWVAVLGSIYQEQNAKLTRYKDQPTGYSLAQVYGRAQTGGVSRYTAGLFDPVLKSPPSYLAGNWMHASNYIGIGLLPLLGLFFFWRWSRIDITLLSTFVVSCLVTAAAGTFILLWQITPGMRALLHALYFYSYFIEIAIIFIAVRMLDRLVSNPLSDGSPVKPVLIAFLTIGFGALCFVFSQSQYVDSDTPALSSFGYAGLYLMVGAGILLGLVGARRSQASFLGILFVFVMFGDLSRYYWVASANDQLFTLAFRKVELVGGRLPKVASDGMRKVWPLPDKPTKLDADIARNLPVETSLWPDNNFNPSSPQRIFQGLPEDKKAALTPSGAMALVDTTQTDQGRDEQRPSREPRDLSYRIIRWGYNRMQFEIDASRSGALLLKQAFDPGWIYRINGQRTPSEPSNLVMTTLPVPAGKSVVEMEFWPLSRRLFFPARYMTLLCCALLLVFMYRENRRQRLTF